MPNDRMLTFQQVHELVGFTRRWLSILEGRKAFPRRVQLGLRRVAWSETEIKAWLQHKMAARDNS